MRSKSRREAPFLSERISLVRIGKAEAHKESLFLKNQFLLYGSGGPAIKKECVLAPSARVIELLSISKNSDNRCCTISECFSVMERNAKNIDFELYALCILSICSLVSEGLV